MSVPVIERESCDLLIVGAGPAGMAAALAAAPSGASIVVIDDNPAPGGQIWRDGPGAHLPPAARKRRDALARCANIRVCTGARVIAAPAPSELLVEDAERAWRIHWHRLVLCTGARERLLPFPGWTLPGVTGAGGLQALIKSGLPVQGERIVIAGSGPLLLAAAATARRAGAQVRRIAEQASAGSLVRFAAGLVRWPGKAIQALQLADARYRWASHVIAAEGGARLESVRLVQGGHAHEMACDRLAVGFGLVPNTGLGQLLGCALTPPFSGAGETAALAVDAWQATNLPGVYAAGECTGFGGSERALAQGAIAGHAAIGEQEAARRLHGERARWDAFAAGLHRHFALAPAIRAVPRADTLVCRCEDVSLGQLAACSGWPDAKLHQRCGMGPCQGRVCGDAAQFLFGWTPPAPRPPLSPARMATLAGLGADTAPAPAHPGTQ